MYWYVVVAALTLPGVTPAAAYCVSGAFICWALCGICTHSSAQPAPDKVRTSCWPLVYLVAVVPAHT